MKSYCWTLIAMLGLSTSAFADHIGDIQTKAIQDNHAPWGYWGPDAKNFMGWGSHSNRLIPVYTFGTAKAGPGINLKSYQGENSPYASEEKLKKLYGQVPTKTLNPTAPYFDQTNIFDIQNAALAAGKKHIILVVFDGMDWQTTRNAAIYKNQAVAYDSGRGTGLHMLDYKAGGTSEFGWMVTSPWCDEAKLNVDDQTVLSWDHDLRGGYAFDVAGLYPWSNSTDAVYPISKSKVPGYNHAYTDSASSATSMTCGIKTYNASINVAIDGTKVDSIAHLAQNKGYKVGVVTSVPISHATPGSAYGNNVHRDDYQDITRDLLGLPSASHPTTPRPGLDLLIGGGAGVNRAKDAKQGQNFVPGNAYLTDEDLQKVDVRNGGKYVVAIRSEGVRGTAELSAKAEEAAETGKRLFGYYGTSRGNLPFQTADGQYDPVPGRSKNPTKYSENDIKENPKLAEIATIALDYLNSKNEPFWLMLEAGDVDWANHDNNIDTSIGAVLSGDDAVKAVTDWVEKNSNWDETVMIVTADHGHYFTLTDPQALLSPKTAEASAE